MRVFTFRLLLLVATTLSRAAEPAEESAGEVRGLILRLSSQTAADREAATARLVAMGGKAVAALKDVQNDATVPAVTREAADAALHAIGENAARDQDTLRPKGNTAMSNGHFAEAAMAFEQLTLWEKAEIADWLGLARAREKLAQAPHAVAAYQEAIKRMDVRLSLTPQDLLNEWEQRARNNGGRGKGPALTIESAREALGREQSDLRPLRMRVHGELGHVQLDQLKDAAAAEKTFRAGLAGAPASLMQSSVEELVAARRLGIVVKDPLKGRLGEHAFHLNELMFPSIELLNDLAAAQERQGHLREAIDSLARSAIAQAENGGHASLVDVAPMYRLVRKLKPDAELPSTPMLHILTPDHDTFAADFSDEDDIAAAKGSAAFWQFTHSGMRAYRFFLAPPPGKQFDRVVVTVVMERKEKLKMGYGVRLVDWNSSIDSREAPLGARQAITKTFSPPAGKATDLLHLEVMSTAAEPFTIHQVKVQAVLREEQKDPAAK